MSTIKTVLALLAFLCVYGVVGRLDYDDAVMLENARTKPDHTNCRKVPSVASTNEVRNGLANISAESETSSADPCNILIY